MNFLKTGYNVAMKTDRMLWRAERTEHRIRRAQGMQRSAKHFMISRSERKRSREKERANPGPSGALSLTIVEARDLRISDAFSGKSDPYVKIRVGDEKKRTRTVRNSLDPRWDETFDFDTSARYFELKIKDKDIVGKDEFLGFLRISLEPFESGEVVDDWFDLEGGGSIHLIVEFVLDSLRFLERPDYLNDDLDDDFIAQHVVPAHVPAHVPVPVPVPTRPSPSIYNVSHRVATTSTSTNSQVRQNPHSQPQRRTQYGGGSSILPGSMRQGLSRNTGARPGKGIPCAMCGEPARIFCVECQVSFCDEHNHTQHRFGATQRHQRAQL